jgi:hypothetical protein
MGLSRSSRIFFSLGGLALIEIRIKGLKGRGVENILMGVGGDVVFYGLSLHLCFVGDHLRKQNPFGRCR